MEARAKDLSQATVLKRCEGKGNESESKQEMSLIYRDICEIFPTSFGIVWNCFFSHWTSSYTIPPYFRL